MTTTIGIDEAQANLKDLIARLGPRDEVVITENNQPIARISPLKRRRPQFGNCRGMLIVASDDEEHLQDFQDYMP